MIRRVCEIWYEALGFAFKRPLCCDWRSGPAFGRADKVCEVSDFALHKGHFGLGGAGIHCMKLLSRDVVIRNSLV